MPPLFAEPQGSIAQLKKAVRFMSINQKTDNSMIAPKTTQEKKTKLSNRKLKDKLNTRLHESSSFRFSDIKPKKNVTKTIFFEKKSTFSAFQATVNFQNLVY
jgi:hypothetical protein